MLARIQLLVVDGEGGEVHRGGEEEVILGNKEQIIHGAITDSRVLQLAGDVSVVN
jgi:hypothetical protein